ncbi:MAG: ABC transporter permease [Lachnospiraceae bacterium]|nr:ABC transporter permease [Lachnospiraceae bacterium]MDD3616693.1 ABC transporter permease [Lachnospiraceae bacterium]
MTVFKGYMKITKRNIGFILMYVAIFLGVSIAMQASASKNEGSSYAAEKLDIAVVDEDGGMLAKGLENYLKQYHEVSYMENDEGIMQEAIYYENVDLIIRIPVDFEENCLEKGEELKVTKVPGTYNSIYAQQQINTFLNEVKTYMAAGYSMEDGLEKIAAQKPSEVNLIDLNGNSGQMPGYAYMFRYAPYMFLAALCYVLGLILTAFQEKDVKSRMLVSATPQRRQVGEAILSFLVLGVTLFIIDIGITFALNGREFLEAPNLIYYLANTFVLMLVCLALAFLLGMFITRASLVNTIVTPLSLGMSFLCGVFVPLSMLGKGVKKFAQFLPVYWYEVNNDLLSEYQSVEGSVRNTMLKGYGVQLLFAAAFIGIALAVSKYRKQVRN